MSKRNSWFLCYNKRWTSWKCLELGLNLWHGIVRREEVKACVVLKRGAIFKISLMVSDNATLMLWIEYPQNVPQPDKMSITDHDCSNSELTAAQVHCQRCFVFFVSLCQSSAQFWEMLWKDSIQICSKWFLTENSQIPLGRISATCPFSK